MTELKFEKKIFKGAHLNGCSDFPGMSFHKIPQIKTHLDEDDELFVGYGALNTILPYQVQDRYDRAEDDIEMNTAVLENEYLKATFVPELGGRMWSLYDKVEKKNLITDNPVFRPGNLALRNAWVCGGVEWNIGMIGHSPFTCSPLFTAQLEAEDGTPVLRMYEFERIRCATYQMDFFLPENSRFLFARMRIVNPNETVIPMYWWSNIAVPEQKENRVIVPVQDTFSNDYINETERALQKVPVPYGKHGFDLTYPVRNPIAIDYFFNIPHDERKFETQLNRDGYGLIQTSTDRLQGRKLFVWGQGPGGHRWQKFLTNEKGSPYQEMQAGLAKTQTECLPMPPKTAWEWLEAYGAMKIDGEKAHGDWNIAVKNVSHRLEELLPRKKLDEMLQKTKKDFVFKKGKVIWQGSGWGALENERRKKEGLNTLSTHLDFGKVQKEQLPWNYLLNHQAMEKQDVLKAPGSYIIQDFWFDLLKKAARQGDRNNWSTWMHLGICYYARNHHQKARECFEKSLEISENVWALYGLANTFKAMDQLDDAAELMAKASAMRPDDCSLAKEALKIMAACNKNEAIFKLVKHLNPNIIMGKVKYYYAYALAHTGHLRESEELLLENGGIVIPDMQEGEKSTSDLWIYIQTEKARENGENMNDLDIKIPAALDFRMNVPSGKR